LITFVTVIHVTVCIFLILVILLQAGKGGGMAGLGGGGGSQTVFGGRGSQSFLGRVTSVSAAVFMLTSVWLAYHSSKSYSPQEKPAPAGSTAPAQPAPQPEKQDATQKPGGK
jgi:preprotein translocase subunit SecG